jgi:membrane protein DedA with SNARE-associated domain
MMSLEQLISNYGYAAIALGTFLEGETVVILGGLAAHRGYLQLPWVIVCAFLGTIAGDQLFFWLGRIKGAGFLEHRTNFKARADHIFGLMEKHHVLLILGFRFLYGLRTLTPFLLGASGVSPLRFSLLNLLGGLGWSLTIGLLGYGFGYTLETMLGDLKHYEGWVFAGALAAGLLIWAVHFWRNRSGAGPAARA